MNPYVGKDGRWYFYDETGDVWGPFNTEAKAKKALDAYCRWLNHGPTLWQRIWWPIKKLFR